jgi:hypothetical protein
MPIERIGSATGRPCAVKNFNLPQIGDNLFRLMPLPSHYQFCARLISHTAERITFQGGSPLEYLNNNWKNLGFIKILLACSITSALSEGELTSFSSVLLAR